MTGKSVATQITTFRAQGGYARLARFGLCRVAGKDAEAFLQSRLSNDVVALKPGGGQLNTLLDRKAHVLASFSLHKKESEYWILAEQKQISLILEQLETYHFREAVEYEDLSPKYAIFMVAGIKCGALLAEGSLLLPEKYGIGTGMLFDFPAAIISQPIAGEPGYYLFVDIACRDVFYARLSGSAKNAGMTFLSDDALKVASLEAGIAEYAIDISSDNLIFETGLENTSLSYTKGCFCGQEVVARVKGQGAPRRGLVGLVFQNTKHDEGLQIDAPIVLEGKEIGQLKSNSYSPTLEKFIALAYLKSEYRVPGQTLAVEIAGKSFSASVSLLPFYQRQNLKQTAEKLYEEALAAFASDKEEDACAMLYQVLLLDPDFADAFEVLGVVLAREGKLAQAISLMKRLSELDPGSVMAHSNLSLYYANLGQKEEAENEKAIALSIQMQKLSDSLTKEKVEAKAKEEEERKTRLSMFTQVLEIDPEDQLANYGLGTICVETCDFARAIEHLQKSIEAKPDHTVSYLALAKAFEGAGQTAMARETLEKGIKVAAKKGDMMPLEEMQKKQNELALK